MSKEELIDYLVDDAEYEREEVESWDEYTLIDRYLTWEGIINYTYDIVDTVRRVYGDLKDEE